MTRLMVVMACCMAILGGWSVAASGEEKADKPETKTYSVDEIRGLLRESDQTRLESRIEEWRAGPSYLLPGLLEELAGRIMPDKKRDLQDYLWGEGTHDLNQPAGRATWAIEQLTGLDLPKVKQGCTQEDLSRIRDEVLKLVEAYNAGFVAAASRIRPERTLDELKKDYHGKIKTGVDQKGYEASFLLMTKLFNEWMPLGKKLSDLEEITGAQGVELEDLQSVDYPFENGWNGVLYRLKVADGIIVSVSVTSID